MRARNSLEDGLADNRALLGLLQTRPHDAFAELAAGCGYDFIVLDLEHGLFTDRDCLIPIQIMAGLGLLSVVRLPTTDPAHVGRFLDMGADVILVPNVTTVEQAEALARAMEFAPNGTRGVGAPLHRVTRYGLDWGDYAKAPRGDAKLIVMIESAAGVANVEAIVAVEGVDGLFVGPIDLSADLGCLGRFSDPAYVDALARSEQAAGASGKLLGSAPHGDSSASDLNKRGYRLLLLGADIPLLRDIMTQRIAASGLLAPNP